MSWKNRFEKTSFILRSRGSHARILIVDEEYLVSISRRVLGEVIYSKMFPSSQEILVILENKCVYTYNGKSRIFEECTPNLIESNIFVQQKFDWQV